jgi:hypothetical protein
MKGLKGNHKSNMTPERIVKLESLGFNWNLRKSKSTRIQAFPFAQDEADMDTSDESDDESSIHQTRTSSVKQVPNEVNETFEKDDQEKDLHGAQDGLWNERLNELEIFRENHGLCVVPQYLPLGVGHAAAI